LVKTDEPGNCFTLVMDSWDGFLFVTAEAKREKNLVIIIDTD